MHISNGMFLVFDIGGTKMRVAASADGETLSAVEVAPTPQDYDEGIQKLLALGHQVSGGVKIKAVAGGIAGPFSEQRASLVSSPNLAGWVGRPLRQTLEQEFSVPVYIENDSALAALGEAVRGAGQGFRIVAYLTISTGVGGARVVDGRLDERAIGFEPGQQVINVETNKTLENCVSGTAIAKRFHQPPQELTDPNLWEELAHFLAYGINNTIVYWSPEVVVLGGGMMGVPGISLEAVERHLRGILKIFPDLPPLKKAVLGDRGGLIGALEYLKQKLANWR